jgi:hypothetical protein
MRARGGCVSRNRPSFFAGVVEVQYQMLTFQLHFVISWALIKAVQTRWGAVGGQGKELLANVP